MRPSFSARAEVAGAAIDLDAWARLYVRTVLLMGTATAHTSTVTYPEAS